VTDQDPVIPFVGEDNIIRAANYPPPDGLWPDSHRIFDKTISTFYERVRRPSGRTTRSAPRLAARTRIG
jgi:hypothetical protein